MGNEKVSGEAHFFDNIKLIIQTLFIAGVDLFDSTFHALPGDCIKVVIQRTAFWNGKFRHVVDTGFQFELAHFINA